MTFLFFNCLQLNNCDRVKYRANELQVFFIRFFLGSFKSIFYRNQFVIQLTKRVYDIKGQNIKIKFKT